MKNYSVWKDNYKETNYNSLDKDISCDVLIIGGGLTGVSSLFNLRDSGLDVVLVEQNKIGLGVTSNSTGKLTYLQNDLIDKIRKFYSDSVALEYINSQIDSINNICNIIDKYNISCDLEKVNSYIYTNKESEVDSLIDLFNFFKKNGFIVHKGNHKLVKSKYMFYVSDAYIFNPLKFINGLLKYNKYPIYENTSIIDMKRCDDYYVCYTKFNKIKAKYVIIASHYPYFLNPLLFPLKVSLEKSYLSLSSCDIEPFSLISYSNPFVSMRTYKNNLVYLSNSHSINSDCDMNNFNELLKKISDLGLSPDYLWSNIDIITSDGIPYIGKINNNLFIGTGYNTWGLSNGFLAGMILSELILNNRNQYTDLFNPRRGSLEFVIPYTINAFKSIDGFIKGYCSSFSTKYKCPHLGCKLIYNDVENTFDCPCHGSRFDSSGKCINGPSNKDIVVSNYKN